MRRVALPALVLASFACGETLPARDDDAGAPSDASFADGSTSDASTDAPSDCEAANGCEVLATGQANAGEVMVDDERVYWTIDTDVGTIRARELVAGGVPHDLSTDTGRPRSLTSSGAFIYFARGNDGRHIERNATGGGSTSLTATVAGPMTSILRAGDTIFATFADKVQWCVTTASGCLGMAFNGEQGVGVGARALAVDTAVARRVWLASDDYIWRSDLASPAFTKWWPLTNVSAIAADETAVFIARNGEGGITKFGRDAATTDPPGILAPGGPKPWALAIDAGDVFYTSLEANVVMQVSKDGSSVRSLAALQRPKGIAVRLDKVYVSLSDGRIVSLRRK
jgi:hypothetical protein